jgi:hypothetical protein
MATLEELNPLEFCAVLRMLLGNNYNVAEAL